MNQADLYAALDESRCTVVAFEDHPGFFGNWRALFKRGHELYEIVSDNREGWLTLWRKASDGKGEKLYEVESTTFDDTRELAALTGWLLVLASQR
jgi:hypothetical protein